MRQLILKMSISVDGFVGGPNGEIEWLFKTMDEGATAWVLDTVWQAGAHIMGSRTFYDMASYWPYSMEPFAAPEMSSWTDARVAGGDLTTEILRLKQENGKPLLAHGGASFAQSLAKAGLIDEYRLLIHPVVLGTGLSLFSAIPKPTDLQLINTTAFKSGAIANVYRPA